MCYIYPYKIQTAKSNYENYVLFGLGFVSRCGALLSNGSLYGFLMVYSPDKSVKSVSETSLNTLFPVRPPYSLTHTHMQIRRQTERKGGALNCFVCYIAFGVQLIKDSSIMKRLHSLRFTSLLSLNPINFRQQQQI